MQILSVLILFWIVILHTTRRSKQEHINFYLNKKQN